MNKPRRQDDRRALRCLGLLRVIPCAGHGLTAAFPDGLDSCIVQLARPVNRGFADHDHLHLHLRRERGVHLARQSVARAGAGDPAGAGDVGIRAARIAGLTGSGRIATDLRRLDRTMRRRWPSHSATDEVHHALTSLVVSRQPRAQRG